MLSYAEEIGDDVLHWVSEVVRSQTHFGGSGILNNKAENHHNCQQHEQNKSQICFLSIMYTIPCNYSETPVILE